MALNALSLCWMGARYMYILSIRLRRLRWEYRTVMIMTLGLMAVGNTFQPLRD